MTENKNMPTVIINGGLPIKDCPTDKGEADRLIALMNVNHEEGFTPLWSWDCGYKLDFDGPILSISSRFYPPKSHQGDTWDGNVSIYISGKEVEVKAFDCETLNDLTKQVHEYINNIQDRLVLLV